MIKLIFQFLNIIFILFYIFPGSILGFIIYGDIYKQPQITSNFIVSSNHVFAFLLLSIIGLLSYIKNQNKIILYLLTISIILESTHLFIPNRSFQFPDLFGNIIGVLISLLILIIINYWRKK